MAFINSFQEDEDKKKLDEFGNPVIAPESGDVAGPAASDQSKPSSSGSYVNLQKYVDANADNSPSSFIASKIGEQGDRARAQLADSTSQFNQRVQQGSQDVDRNLVDRAFSDPTSFVKNQADFDAFKKQRDNSYAGPDSLYDIEGYNPTAGREVANSLNQFDSEPGQFALLQRYAGRPSYSSGEQNLDQLILSTSPKTQQDFAQVKSAYGGINNDYNTAESAASAAAQARKADAVAGSSYAREQGMSRDQELRNLLAQRQQAAVQEQMARLASLQQAAQNRQATPLGLQSGMHIFGVNPGDYIRTGEAPSVNTIISPEEQSRAAALSQLMGQENTLAPYASLAGTYDPNRAAYFDASGFQNAVNQRGQAYAQQKNTEQIDLSGLGLFGSVDPNLGNFLQQGTPTLTSALSKLEELRLNQQNAGHPLQDYSNTLSDYISHINSRLSQIDDDWGAGDVLNDLPLLANTFSYRS